MHKKETRCISEYNILDFRYCFKKCVAIIISHTKSDRIKELLASALTDKINDRETFMKGIDYTYYYEQED